MVCAQNHSEREEILDHSSDLRCGRCHIFWIFHLSPFRPSGVASCSSAFRNLANQMAELRGYGTRNDDAVLGDLGRRLPEQRQPRLELAGDVPVRRVGKRDVASCEYQNSTRIPWPPGLFGRLAACSCPLSERLLAVTRKRTFTTCSLVEGRWPTEAADASSPRS
jgi:hypothetical protein